MVNPVPRSVEREWMILYDTLINLVTKTEQDVEAGSGDNGVSGVGEGVITREGLSRVGKPRRH